MNVVEVFFNTGNYYYPLKVCLIAFYSLENYASFEYCTHDIIFKLKIQVNLQIVINFSKTQPFFSKGSKHLH